MTASKFLAGLKTNQLKTLAFWTGIPSTGRKADLQSVLARRAQRPPCRSEFSKVLSIDMGVRNLAICLLEAPWLSANETLKVAARPRSSPLTVSAWQKIDVLGRMKESRATDTVDSDSETNAPLEHDTSRDGGENHSPVSTDFTPERLSQAAYSLVSSLLLQHQPSCILIERQRFRSGGGFAVQEWTLRVNLLEHMIWACLRTLRAQSKRDLSESGQNELLSAASKLEAVYEVSPARVARFWCGGLPVDFEPNIISAGGGVSGSHEGRETKISKADKIAVAQGWVDASQISESVHLDFVGQAAGTASAFQSSLGKRKGRKTKGSDEESIGKLDDLADCLLQGVAWVKWEENRRRLAEVIADEE